MNIGPPIDWAATGTMLSGFATLAGAVAVAFAAWFGARQWRAQKVSEAHMDAAREILKTVYELEDGVRFVLADVIANSERQARENQIKKEHVRLTDLDPHVAAEILTSRFTFISQIQNDSKKKLIDARICFGSDGRDKLEAIRQIVIEIEASTNFVREKGPSDSSFIAELWKKNFPDDPKDGYLDKIRSAIKSLEASLIPLIQIR